jgi:hypothetical protein
VRPFAEAAIEAVECVRADPTSQEAQEALSLLEILARFMLEPPTLEEVRRRYKAAKVGLPSEAQASLAAACEALAPIDTLRKRLELLNVIKEYE